MQYSGNGGMPQGLMGRFQLPQFAPPQHYAPSMAQQNAQSFLSQPPPQQQDSSSGPDMMGMANMLSALKGPPSSMPITLAGTGAPYAGGAAPGTTYPGGAGVWSPNTNAAPGQDMFGSYQQSVQPYIAPSTQNLNVGMPNLQGQTILSRLFGR